VENFDISYVVRDNMRVKKIPFLIVAVLSALALSAGACYAVGQFPNSQYAEDNGWQGSTRYQEEGMDLLVFFTVYDTETYQNEFTWEAELDQPDDRFVYAYQIVNDPFGLGGEDIDYFSILKLDGTKVDATVIHATTSQKDNTEEGIWPEPLVSSEQGAWEWSSLPLATGEFSTWLIFTSDSAPTKGKFEAKVSEYTEPPVPDVPEPAAVLLMGLGALTLLRKRNTVG
jgi:hypothetical protein